MSTQCAQCGPRIRRGFSSPYWNSLRLMPSGVRSRQMAGCLRAPPSTGLTLERVEAPGDNLVEASMFELHADGDCVVVSDGCACGT